MDERQYTISRIAEVASGVALQSGVAATDIAGLIVSFLYANPEHIERFLREGTELFIDGTIRTDHGSLSYVAGTGEILTPAELRRRNGEPVL